MRRFLKRPYPINDESLDGYISRLAISNNLTKRDTLAGLGCSSISKSRDIESRSKLVKELNRYTGFPQVSELFDPRKLGLTYKALFDFSMQKYCFECLLEKPFIRSLWSFKNYVTCHVHKTNLANKCEYCQSNLNDEAILARNCFSCSSKLNVSGNKHNFVDPVSKFIGNVMLDNSIRIETALFDIKSRVDDLEPYIRLQMEGRYKPANDLRKSNILEFAKMQKSASELINDEEKSVAMLVKQLSKHVSKNDEQSQISYLLHKYSKFLKEPNKYRFANVMKKALSSTKIKQDEESWLTLEFISVLWQVEEEQIAAAFDHIDPEIRNGKKKVRLTDFSSYADKVLPILSSKNRTIKS